MAQALIERYENRLHGVLSCYDRVVVTGTLPGACYAEGMTAFLSGKGIRISMRGSQDSLGTGKCQEARPKGRA